MRRRIGLVIAAWLLSSVTAVAESAYLMVPNYSTGNKSVMLFNRSDGSLVQQNWIVGDPNNVFSTITEALAIGTDVWITDQVANKVFRYDLTTGTYKSALTGSGTTNLSNIRGIERVGNTVYVANTGTGFGNAIVMFDATNGTYLGNFAVQSGLGAWDVKYYTDPNNYGQLLVSNYSSSMTTGVSRIDRYDLAGSFVGNFYLQNNNAGTGLIGPQQMNVEAGGNLLVGGFMGSGTQSGVYELNSYAEQLAKYAGGLGPRAAYRLDNGKIMFTKGDGVWSWDPNGVVNPTSLFSGSNVNAKYINEIPFMPEPTSLALLGLGILVVRRR